MLTWLLWELAVLGASVRLAYSCGWRRDRGTQPEEALLAVVGIDVLLASSLATVLSFAQRNSAAAYLVIALVLLAGGLLITPRRAITAARELWEASAGLIVCRHPFFSSALLVAFVPLFFLPP